MTTTRVRMSMGAPVQRDPAPSLRASKGALRALGVRCRTDRHASTSQVVRATLDGPPAALREVPVTFSFPKSLDFGQTLCVVGADPQIGSWDPLQAIQLEWSEGDLWTGSVHLPADTQCEFKWVVKGAQEGEWFWQPTEENMVLDLSNIYTEVKVQLVDDWQLSMEVAPATPPPAPPPLPPPLPPPAPLFSPELPPPPVFVEEVVEEPVEEPEVVEKVVALAEVALDLEMKPQVEQEVQQEAEPVVLIPLVGEVEETQQQVEPATPSSSGAVVMAVLATTVLLSGGAFVALHPQLKLSSQMAFPAWDVSGVMRQASAASVHTKAQVAALVDSLPSGEQLRRVAESAVGPMRDVKMELPELPPMPSMPSVGSFEPPALPSKSVPTPTYDIVMKPLF